METHYTQSIKNKLTMEMLCDEYVNNADGIEVSWMLEVIN
jgi:hypothetical protein